MKTTFPEPKLKNDGKLLLESLIAQHPFFDGMPPNHLKILAESAMLTKFEENQLVVRAGDVANRFYLILEGKVALESAGEDGEAILIQTLEPGDELGWSWMFLPYHWHFDARAIEATKAIFFYGTQVRARCEEDHDLGYELMKRITQVLVKRLEATTGRLLSHH
ncbi:MAG: cyclic nucleotide-binding domain-containing protein [Verrucomicrobia bacterium]|nr:cyclic nucleotide-binding domain-containing protein [Verrucomicrobiota bacterium]